MAKRNANQNPHNYHLIDIQIKMEYNYFVFHFIIVTTVV